MGGGRFLVPIGEGDLRLNGKSFGERKSVRDRDVNLIAVGGFGLGKLEGVDSLARGGRNVRVLVRGRKKRGFEGVGARASSSRLSIMGGAHRGDKRRVVEKVSDRGQYLHQRQEARRKGQEQSAQIWWG